MKRALFTLQDFVEESNRIEGIFDVRADEVLAHERFLQQPEIRIPDLCDLVYGLQPNARLRIAQGMNVRVGNHYPPVGGPHIHEMLARLLSVHRHSTTPWRCHVEYEMLHPFTDGNGRSGRALWLWHMGGIDKAPLGFLHHFYYQTLSHAEGKA